MTIVFRERYRDLIEAADTITEMKRSADNVSILIMQWYLYTLLTFVNLAILTSTSLKLYPNSK